jgi:hypothetical protein
MRFYLCDHYQDNTVDSPQIGHPPDPAKPVTLNCRCEDLSDVRMSDLRTVKCIRILKASECDATMIIESPGQIIGSVRQRA